MTGLIIGLVLGILGSIIAWYIAVGVITPALAIRNSMELIRIAGQPPKYRVAVRNRRLFRDAQDVSIRVRCSYLSHSRRLTGSRIRKAFEIPVDDAWVPLIRSRWYWRKHLPKGRSSNDHWPLLPVLSVNEVDGSASTDAPRDDYGLLDLFEILGADYEGRVDIAVIAYDSWSGTKKLFYKRFHKDDLNILDTSDTVPNLD